MNSELTIGGDTLNVSTCESGLPPLAFVWKDIPYKAAGGFVVRVYHLLAFAAMTFPTRQQGENC